MVSNLKSSLKNPIIDPNMQSCNENALDLPLYALLQNHSLSNLFPDTDNNQDSTPPSSSSSVRPILPPTPSIPTSARTSRGHNEIPMPTLYNGSDGSSNNGHPDGQGRNMGAMGTILYNMASILAGVAVGYDVRLSNVSPIHPKLYPKR